MWHKPQLMIALSDLLFVAGAAVLLVAGIMWGVRLPFFPLRELVVMHELKEVHRSEVERSLAGRLRGNFFSVNLDTLRQSLEQLPWVRRAEVRRQWPSRIEVSLEEHVPAAYWGTKPGQLVNTFGEVFAATLEQAPPLPQLSGPTGTSAEVLSRYQEFSEKLKAIGRQPEQIVLSPRMAWLLKLEDGMLVELGREQAKAPISMRLERFVEHYPTVSDARRARPVTVDMRYPNGFTLRFAGSVTQDSRGKP